MPKGKRPVEKNEAAPNNNCSHPFASNTIECLQGFKNHVVRGAIPALNDGFIILFDCGSGLHIPNTGFYSVCKRDVELAIEHHRLNLKHYRDELLRTTQLLEEISNKVSDYVAPTEKEGNNNGN
jgi:hypothetical protein